MHQNLFLSKEVSGVHELCWHFWNNQLFDKHVFFHENCLLTLVLSLIPSSFVSATDLRSAILKNLSDFALSSVSRYLLCSSTLPSSGFFSFLLMFSSVLLPCVYWTLYLHYQLWYFFLWPPYHDWRFPHLLSFPQYAS
jgi:hypothetical protein